MSRVHDALRKAAQTGVGIPAAENQERPIRTSNLDHAGSVLTAEHSDFLDTLDHIVEVPLRPSQDSLLIDPSRPHEAPTEEFRSLRTRLNHMQTLQPIHTVVVTSASPTEGKSFAAMNLALTQSQLAGKRVLIADFDFRRPIVHNLMQIDRTPG